MNWFRNFKVRQRKIEELLNQIAELEVQKKSAEARRTDIELDLKNKSRENEMRMDDQRHQSRMALEAKEAQFTREKKLWEEDKIRLQDETKRDQEKFKTEVTALCKLDYDQRIAQAKVDFDRKVQDLEAKHQREMVTKESECNNLERCWKSKSGSVRI